MFLLVACLSQLKSTHALSLKSTDMSPRRTTSVDTSGRMECGLYMAESSVANTGLGMFAGGPLGKRWKVSHGNVVLRVTLRSTTAFAIGTTKTLVFRELKRDCWMITFGKRKIQWAHLTLVQSRASLPVWVCWQTRILAWPRLRCAHQDVPQTCTVERTPGSGASTTYHNSVFQATRDIEPGAEIFVDYRTGRFTDWTSTLGEIPLRNSFIKADALLQKFWNVTGGQLDTCHNNGTVQTLPAQGPIVE